MIDFIRLIRKGSKKNLRECANETFEIGKQVSDFVSNQNWVSSDDKALSFENPDSFKTEVINYYKSTIKREDGMTVESDYCNEYGNRYAFSADKSFDKIKLTSNLGNYVNKKSTDVLMLENLKSHINLQRDEVLSLFQILIDSFSPTHATISSEELAFDVIDFATKEIWTGWMTFISFDLNLPNYQEFDMIEISGKGVIYVIDEKEPDFVGRVTELTEKIRSSMQIN